MTCLTPYLQAWLAGARAPMMQLVGMRLRRADVKAVVVGRIFAVKHSLDIGLNELETHCMAGGDVRRVVDALAAAKEAGADLSWAAACKLDLEGHDPREAVGVFASDRRG